MPIVQATAFGPTNRITGLADPIYSYQNVLSADQEAANRASLEIERLRQQFESQRATSQLQGDIYRADRDANTQLQLGTLQSDSTRRGQDFDFAAAMRGYDVTEGGNQLRAETDRRGQDLSRETTMRGQDFSRETTMRGQDLDFRAAMAPVEWQRDRFAQVLPLFTGVLRDFGSADFGGPLGADPATTGGVPMRGLGGSNLPQPEVTVGGVYTPQQTQQQLNAGYARTAAMAGTQRRKIAESAGARGLGGASPLLMALGAGVGAAQMGADAETARETQLAHAKANAEQQLASEGLRGQMWQAANQGDIARRQIVQQQQNALVMALAGML